MTNEQDTTPICFATLGQICEQLDKRYKHYILVTSDEVKNKGDNKTAQKLSYNGGFVGAIGLCEYGKQFLLKRSWSNTNVDEDGSEDYSNG